MNSRYLPAAGLAIVNSLVQLVGVLAFGWPIGNIFLLLWAENVIITLVAIVRMAGVRDAPDGGAQQGLVLGTGQRRGFARGSGDDQRLGAARKLGIDQAQPGVGIECAGGRERRCQRGNAAGKVQSGPASGSRVGGRAGSRAAP